MRSDLYNSLFKIIPIVFIWLYLFTNASNAQTTLFELKDNTQEVFITKAVIGVFIDSSQRVSNNDITNVPDALFVPSNGHTIANLYPKATYWLKFKVVDNSVNKKWLIESFNYRINNIQIVIPSLKYTSKPMGDTFNFKDRDVKHKNFLFSLPPLSPYQQTIYIKVYSKQTTNLQFVLREANYFTSYAIYEYFLLGIFYGVILMVALYNLFLFFVFKRSPFIYYFAYILSTILYFMTNDGTCFHFLWPTHPSLNQYAFQITHFLMVIFFCFYAKSFLQIDNLYPFINKVFKWFVIIRIILFLVSITTGYFFGTHILYIDYLPFVFAYVTAVLLYKKDKSNYMFFIIAFTIIFICFTINGLRLMRVIPSNLFSFYAIYVGVMFEMLFLTLGLSTKLNSIIKFGILKDRVNKLLSNKLKDSSRAISLQGSLIKEREAEIETLFYRLSHDIKGPLKSIKGLALLGLMEEGSDKKYYDMILERLEHLNFMTDDFVEISKIKKETTLSKHPINIRIFVKSIIAALPQIEQDTDFNLILTFEKEETHFGEPELLRTIFQNIIENSYQYRNLNTTQSYLKIKINSELEGLTVIFEDNGIGVPEDLKKNIFQMFFRANETKDNTSTGLGLYIVKIAVEKMNGTISFSSTLGIGTKFEIFVPKMK